VGQGVFDRVVLRRGRFRDHDGASTVIAMQDREPTARAREIGLILAKAAKQQNYTGATLAEWLGWSQSKVSRIFKGNRPPSVDDAVALTAVCRVVGEEREHVLRLAKDANEPNWLQEYGDRLPSRLRTLVEYEEVTSEITDFETNVVPGLLQVPSYARAVLRTQVIIPPNEIDDRVAARMQRQHIYSRSKPPVCHFYLDEYALVRTGPGREVMSEQAHHLLRMSVRPYIKIRIIPDARGFHVARKPFRLMKFRELKPVVFLEDETGVQFLQRKATITCYQRIIDRLALFALNEGQSRDWIASLASALGAPREEQDDLAEEHVLGGDQLR
jgi:transcriptional regulator with XRE-family HTH domain